jgi:hypothetical protein
MKNIRLIGTALVLLATLICGCEDDNPLSSGGADNTIAAKVDGTAWKNVDISASRVVPPGAITIVGVSAGEQISLQIRSTGTGTYSLSAGEQQWASYSKSGTQYTTTYPGGSGTLIVTKYDEANRLISGTFSFSAKSAGGGTVEITDGVFTNVRWSEQ